MSTRRCVTLFAALLLCFSFAAPVWAAGTVQLELIGDARGAALAFQDWGRSLERAGIRNVRLETAQEPGRPRLDVQGTPESPVYVVRGIVVSRDEIQLPGVRFRRGETAQLAQWLADLAAHGPVEKREKKGAYGLSAAELDRIRQDLAMSVGFHTQGILLRDMLQKTADRLKLPLHFEADAVGDEKVEEQLGTLSCGTALACALRPAGFSLVPRSQDGQLSYAVVKSQADVEGWPVGSQPERSVSELLPALYDFRNVNVQNVSAATLLEAVGKALKTPIVFDRLALTRHDIDPAKAKVSYPKGRTTYSVALRRMLFQARLQFEVRCDETGTPFVWVTTLKSVK
ncbi:MAG: hypothetical protein ABFC63_08135 [Thermoguttaceae bacterium]